jgi:hypothetical protein
VNITNTIAASHTTGMQQAGGAVTAWNTLFFGNTANTAGTVISNTSVAGDPAFVAPAADDYRLTGASAAVDAGNATCPATDIRGQARNDLACDIGAYELEYSDRHSATSTPSTTTMTTYGPALAGILDNGETSPGLTTITKTTTWGGGTPAGVLGAWWNITPETGTGLSVTLKLCYSLAELGGLTEGDLRFWRYSAGLWSRIDITPTLTGVDPKRCAEISGVTDFSSWTMATGDPGKNPTAATLSSLRASADSTTGWLMLAGALAAALALSGAVWFAARRRG